MISKPDFRKECLRISKGITPATADKWADVIEAVNRYRSAKKIFCFVSAMPGEPDTGEIIRRALADGKTVCVPRCGKSGKMDAVEISALSELVAGAYGIPEPPREYPAEDIDTIDFAVVPGLSFDEDGGRMGRGGGYYDRFLEKFNGFSLGLCPKELKSDEIPRESCDKAVNQVIFL